MTSRGGDFFAARLDAARRPAMRTATKPAAFNTRRCLETLYWEIANCSEIWFTPSSSWDNNRTMRRRFNSPSAFKAVMQAVPVIGVSIAAPAAEASRLRGAGGRGVKTASRCRP